MVGGAVGLQGPEGGFLKVDSREARTAKERGRHGGEGPLPSGEPVPISDRTDKERLLRYLAERYRRLSEIRGVVERARGPWGRLADRVSRLGSGPISLAVHAAVLVLLSVWLLAPLRERPDDPAVSVGWRTPGGAATTEDPPGEEPSGDPVQAASRPDPVPVQAPAETPSPRLISVPGAPGPARTAPGSPFAGRRGEGKEGRLRGRGHGEAGERAVAGALQWLAAHQSKDGSWSAVDYALRCPARARCADPGLDRRNDLAVTGLALLAFTGSGASPVRGEHAGVLRSGAEHLASRQGGEGIFRGADGKPVGMYAQAIGAAALAEIAALARLDGGEGGLVEAWTAGARRAVAAILASRNARGGWDYEAGSVSGRTDLSVSGWQWMALRTAEASGIAVERKVWLQAAEILAGATDPDGRVRYADAEPGRLRVTPAMSAVALWARRWLGWPADAPVVLRLRDRVLAHPPAWDANLERNWRAFQSAELAQDPYFWHYASMGLSSLPGEGPRRWEEALRGMLLSSQRRDGHAAGSWDPVGAWSGAGGRVYATAVLTLALEAPYRSLSAPATTEKGEPAPLAWLRSLSGEDRLRFVPLLEDFGPAVAGLGWEILSADPDPAVQARCLEEWLAREDWDRIARLEAAWPFLDAASALRLARRLGEGGDARCDRLLLRLLEEEGPYLRHQAVAGLREAKRRGAAGEEVLSGLVRAARAEREPGMRREVFAALRALSGAQVADEPEAWAEWLRARGAEASPAASPSRRHPPPSAPWEPPPPPAEVERAREAAARLRGLVEAWRKDPEGPADLAAALLAIEAVEHPVDEAAVAGTILRVASLARRGARSASPRDRADALAALLFDTLRFRALPPERTGDAFYLGRVLASRSGNCVGLSSLYWAAAERLRLPVSCARVPGHCYLMLGGEGGRTIETTDGGREVAEETLVRMGEVTARSRRSGRYLEPLGKRSLLAEALNSQASRMQARKRYAEAMAAFDAATALDEGNPALWTNRGSLAAFLGRIEQALSDFARAEALDPDRPAVYVGRAAVRIRLGELDEAAADLDRAEAVRPTADGRIGRGNLLVMRGRPVEAERAYSEAIGMDAADPRAYVFRGHLRRASGDLRGAAGDLAAALERGDRSSATRLELSRLWMRLGERAKALAELDRVLAESPADPQALSLRTDISAGFPSLEPRNPKPGARSPEPEGGGGR